MVMTEYVVLHKNGENIPGGYLCSARDVEVGTPCFSAFFFIRQKVFNFSNATWQFNAIDRLAGILLDHTCLSSKIFWHICNRGAAVTHFFFFSKLGKVTPMGKVTPVYGILAAVSSMKPRTPSGSFISYLFISL